MSDSKEIPQAVRSAVLERDNYRCRRCGTEEGLTLHHVQPRGRLGGHGEDNIVTLCWFHHRMIHDGKLEIKRHNGTWLFKGVI